MNNLYLYLTIIIIGVTAGYLISKLIRNLFYDEPKITVPSLRIIFTTLDELGRRIQKLEDNKWQPIQTRVECEHEKMRYLQKAEQIQKQENKNED